jgi:hypothetical protein
LATDCTCSCLEKESKKASIAITKGKARRAKA